MCGCNIQDERERMGTLAHADTGMHPFDSPRLKTDSRTRIASP